MEAIKKTRKARFQRKLMTYALDLVRRLSERLLAVDLVDNELDLPHYGLRLVEVNASLDRRLLLCLCRCILVHLR